MIDAKINEELVRDIISSKLTYGIPDSDFASVLLGVAAHSCATSGVPKGIAIAAFSNAFESAAESEKKRCG